MTIEIRQVPPTDMRTWLESIETAGSSELTDQTWRDVGPTFEPERTLGAYDGDRIVGGGSIFSFELTVPGARSVRAAGVTTVGVIPTHRRRGILRQLMARQLDDVRAAGEPVAVLWASEGSIYHRFGYGLATTAASINLERERAIFRSADAPVGSVRFLERDEAARIFPSIYEPLRAQTPGFYTRTPTWWAVEVLADFEWSRRGADRKFYALHERDGRPDAYAIYRVKHDWPEHMPASELHVQEIMAIDGIGLREMWRFVFGVDLIKAIKTRTGPPNDPLLQMLLEPRRLGLRIRDGMWLRVVDVPAALQARGYSADGSVVLEVRDDFIPGAGGRWRLTTSGGEGRVEPATDGPEISLDAADLGAVYLGAASLSDLARAGRTEELVPGARARADAMLAWPVVAWCPQLF